MSRTLCTLVFFYSTLNHTRVGCMCFYVLLIWSSRWCIYVVTLITSQCTADLCHMFPHNLQITHWVIVGFPAFFIMVLQYVHIFFLLYNHMLISVCASEKTFISPVLQPSMMHLVHKKNEDLWYHAVDLSSCDAVHQSCLTDVCYSKHFLSLP